MEEGTLVDAVWAPAELSSDYARYQTETALPIGRLKCGNQPAHLKLNHREAIGIYRPCPPRSSDSYTLEGERLGPAVPTGRPARNN